MGPASRIRVSTRYSVHHSRVYCDPRFVLEDMNATKYAGLPDIVE